MKTEITVVRIYLREADKGRSESLLREILKILHDQNRVKGVTVFRGIAGFGDTGEIASADLLHILSSLPVVIEFFDTPDRVEAAIEVLNGLLPAEHIVSWPATQR
jgi:PII-like signaling protein